MDAQALEQQLAKHQQKFELVTPLGKAFCQFRFSGPFLGELIVWDATLQTLSYYLNNHAPLQRSARQFIEVGDVGEHGRRIHIGLNLSRIDEPVVLKTLIMIRQYKRLAMGRHEFGETLHFPK